MNVTRDILVKDAVREALEAKDQERLDNLMFQFVIEEQYTPERLEQLMRQALIEVSKDVRDYWDEPCPCGMDFHDHEPTPLEVHPKSP